MKMMLLVYLLFVTPALGAQQAWQLNKNKNGIKIFTARESTSKFKSVKVEAFLKGNVETLFDILIDVANNKSWVYGTKRSYLLKTISKNDILYYAETSLPMPLSNRDMAIRMQFDIDTITKTLTVKATGVPDALPGKKGLVRITYFKALWNVKADGKDSIRINYFLSLDPGGSIPPGVSNLFVTKGPYETFNNLSGLLKN